MLQIDVKYLGDASKNCIVWVRGCVHPDEKEPFQFLDLEDLATAATGRRPKTLQLASALWTLQEKMGFRIWTSQETRPSQLLLIMESRNFIRFDRAITLDPWSGKLYAEPFKHLDEPKWFSFQLDFDKVFAR